MNEGETQAKSHTKIQQRKDTIFKMHVIQANGMHCSRSMLTPQLFWR